MRKRYRSRGMDNLDGSPFVPEPRKRKVVDPLANQINASATEANGIFTSISHDMKKALMAMKRGDFAMAVQAAGQAALVTRNLSQSLLQFEDLINRMKQREEFKAEQIRLIEAGEYPGSSQTRVV